MISLLTLLLSIIFSKSTITTVAGGNAKEYSSLRGPASSAALSQPNQVTIDMAGNIYVAECGNHVIRRISKDGTISLVAGNHHGGYSGDGGAAINASLNAPSDIAIDNSGNIYIADGWNNRIRKINPLGIIFTIGGTGLRGSRGDNGAASRATFNFPIALALDHLGNLLVVERAGNRVRKISPGGIVTTLAGTGEAGFSGDGGQAQKAQINDPTDIAVDSKDNIYIADLGNNRIRKISSTGVISTFAGTGFAGYSDDGAMATECRMYRPYGVFIDGHDNVYYSDNENALIRKIDTKGIVTTLSGTPGKGGYSGDGGPALKGKIFNPGGIALDNSGNLFIADFGNNAVRKITHVAVK